MAPSTPSGDSSQNPLVSLDGRSVFKTLPNQKDTLPVNRGSRLQFMQTSTPITPSVGVHKPLDGSSRNVNATRRGSTTLPANLFITPEMDNKEFGQTISPTTDAPESQPLQAPSLSQGSFTASSDERPSPNSTHARDATPRERSGSHARPRPAALDTAASLDASLPSPSLSPVTAAANLQSRRSYFEEQASSVPATAKEQIYSPESDSDSFMNVSPVRDHGRSQRPQASEPETRQSSMMDIPDMLDSFEAMPTEMKTYVMFQFLRRCPKSVLHFVADNVNPALKCDFLGLLPPELCQNIIGFLDLKSLCRASQVSKKWRQVIDGDERTWKSLFDQAGFEVAPAELEKAIKEGWGWQWGSAPDEYERDVSRTGAGATERTVSPDARSEASPVSATAPDARSSSTTSARRASKRKVAPKPRAASRKAQKTQHDPARASSGGSSGEAVPRFDDASLRRHLASAEGPYAAAQAAALAVPNPAVGLPGVRALHLYKSLYRRHHLIRSYWTRGERVPPRHTAFKAHHRHVVTCLQFDADKILTGSDDTNINVYDTRSGALKARLDGHEGGVWALQYSGNTLVSGSTDRSVRVWDIEKGVCMHVFQGHTSTVRCLVILMPTVIGHDPSGRPIIMPKEPIIITGSRDSTLRIWKLPRPGETADATVNAPTQSSAAVAAAGLSATSSALGVPSSAITVDESNSSSAVHTPAVIAAAAAAAAAPPASLPNPTTTNATHPNAAAAATTTTTTGESPFFVRALTGHGQSVRAIAAHGDTLVSGSYDHTVRVWRISTGETVHRLTGHNQKVYSVVLDHARRRCISGSMDNLVKVWSLETGVALFTLEGHTSLVGLLDLQRDRLVSAAADSTLRVWDPSTGQCRSVLSAHTGAITCFQHDGRKVVSGSDRSLKMWDVRTGTFLRDLLKDLSGVWQVRFDERRCVAAVQRNNLTYIEVSYSDAVLESESAAD